MDLASQLADIESGDDATPAASGALGGPAAHRRRLTEELQRRLSGGEAGGAAAGGRRRAPSITMKRREDRDAEVGVLQDEVLAWAARLLGVPAGEAPGQAGVAGARSGALLCAVAAAAHPACRPAGKVYGDEQARGNLFLAAENVGAFWAACRDLGVDPSLALDVPDVTEGRAAVLPRTLLACVLQFARLAHLKNGVEPPEIVRAELEIEELRRRRAQALRDGGEALERLVRQENEARARSAALDAEPHAAAPGDAVDAAVGAAAAELGMAVRPARLDAGEYLVGSQHLYVRMVRGVPLALVGSQWVGLLPALGRALAGGGGGGGEPAVVVAGVAPPAPVAVASVVEAAAAPAAAPAPASADLDGDDDAFLALAARVAEPRAGAALQLGERWFERSGARAKRDRSARAYAEYLAEAGREDAASGELAAADVDQIDKDVTAGRTGASCFNEPRLRALLAAAEDADPRAQARLRDVLTAFVVRNPRTGYVQGMNMVAAVLLAFMPEEEAFWTLCAAVEDLRSPDFFSREPPVMGGFQATSHAFAHLANRHFPEARRRFGHDGRLASAVSLAAMRWWIDLFVDSVPLESLVCVLDRFLCGDEAAAAAGAPLAGGDAALVRASLGILQHAERTGALENAEAEPYPALLQAARDVPPRQLLEAMADPAERWFTPAEYLALQRAAREKIRASWDTFQSQFRLLASTVSLTPDDVRDAARALLPARAGGAGGRYEAASRPLVTRDSFEAHVARAGVPLPAEALPWLFAIAETGGDDPHARGADPRELLACLAVVTDATPRHRAELLWEVYAGELGSPMDAAHADLAVGGLRKFYRRSAHIVRSESRNSLVYREAGAGAGGGGAAAEEEEDGDGVDSENDLPSQVLGDGLVDFEAFFHWLNQHPVLLQALVIADKRGVRPMQRQAIEDRAPPGFRKKVLLRSRCCSSITSAEPERYEVYEPVEEGGGGGDAAEAPEEQWIGDECVLQ